MTTKNRAAVSLGRRGGKAKSEAKAAAARANGAKGGKPRSRYCEMCDTWHLARTLECPDCGSPTIRAAR